MLSDLIMLWATKYQFVNLDNLCKFKSVCSEAICLQMYIQNDVIHYACVDICVYVCMYIDVPDERHVRVN
jgi:hypothetical protein